MFEAVTEALRRMAAEPSSETAAEELAHICREEGLDSADAAARYLSELVEQSAEVGADLYDVPWGALGRGGGPTKHPRPADAFWFAGELLDPDQIGHFDDQLLHMVVTPDGHAAAFRTMQEVMACVRSLESIETAVRLTDEPCGCDDARREAADEVRNVPGSGPIFCGRPNLWPHDVQLFQDDFYEGHWIWSAPGFGWKDLRKKFLSHAIFSGRATWNKEISSVKTGDGWTVLFEDVDWKGSSLVMRGGVQACFGQTAATSFCPPRPICAPEGWGPAHSPPRTRVAQLSKYGWNDRASSVLHRPLDWTPPIWGRTRVNGGPWQSQDVGQFGPGKV